MPAIKFSHRAPLLTALLMAGLPVTAFSQTVPADAPLEAQATRRTSFDIPAQPLSQALTAIRRSLPLNSWSQFADAIIEQLAVPAPTGAAAAT